MQFKWLFKMNLRLWCACLVMLTVASAQQKVCAIIPCCFNIPNIPLAPFKGGVEQNIPQPPSKGELGEYDSVRTTNLQEVKVVASERTATMRKTVPVQWMDQKSIQRLGVQELSEAVRLFSGVTVKDYGGIGGLKTVSIRSLGAQHTVVGYDGVAIADAQSGQVDISCFTLDNVEMVSLSTGLDDNIFQTARLFASAGTLHIQTLKPKFSSKPSIFSTTLKGGSFGFFNPALSYNKKFNNQWSLSTHSDYKRADSRYPFTLINGTIKTREKRINSDVETIRIEGNMYGDFGEKGGSIDAKFYAFFSERGLPGSVNFYNQTATERLWNDNRFFQTRYKNQLSKLLAAQAVAKYSYANSRYKDLNDKYAAGYQEDRNTQHEYYGSTGVLFTPFNNLSASLMSDFVRTKLNNNFLNAVQPCRNMLLTVFAVQYQHRSLSATGSWLGTHITDEVKNGDRPANRKHGSPSISFSWRPFSNNTLRIRSSYKDIFRAPTFTDLYYLRVGNKNLKPEKAKQWNVGLTWNGTVGSVIRYLRFSADGYYNKVEDKIVALPTLYIWKMMNMGEVEIKGVDVTISAEMLISAKINATLLTNYTWQDAIDMTNPESKNYRHQIPYTPSHTGNGALTFETPWVNCSFLITAVGERYALPQNIKANRIDAYVEQSFSLNRTFQFQHFTLRLQGEILNIGDSQYDVIQYYPMPGRSWRIGVSIKN